MINKYLTCESCIYYENRYEHNEKGCYWGLIGNFPCCHYIEDAKHYKDRTEVKKRVKVKSLKERKNIKEIE